MTMTPLRLLILLNIGVILGCCICLARSVGPWNWKVDLALAIGTNWGALAMALWGKKKQGVK